MFSRRAVFGFPAVLLIALTAFGAFRAFGFSAHRRTLAQARGRLQGHPLDRRGCGT